jgi:5'-nucleotidase
MSPGGRKFLWIKGGAQDVPTAKNTDAAANLDGYISVTPMKTDLTDYNTLNRLQKLFETNDT